MNKQPFQPATVDREGILTVCDEVLDAAIDLGETLERMVAWIPHLRGLAGWSRETLADRAELTVSTIAILEKDVSGHKDALDRWEDIRRVLATLAADDGPLSLYPQPEPPEPEVTDPAAETPDALSHPVD